VCNSGAPATQNDDNDRDADSCCFSGSVVPKAASIGEEIADLAQCPNRVPGQWNFLYDGCSLQPLPAAFRNNPAGGMSTLFSDDHLPGATHTYACDEHDRCYQTCASPSQSLATSQETCDATLRDIALSTCTSSLLNPLDVLSGATTRCFEFALAYYAGLSPSGLNLGGSAFAERQRQSCQCCQ
jgi:hypothetical protein